MRKGVRGKLRRHSAGVARIWRNGGESDEELPFQLTPKLQPEVLSLGSQFMAPVWLGVADSLAWVFSCLFLAFYFW